MNINNKKVEEIVKLLEIARKEASKIMLFGVSNNPDRAIIIDDNINDVLKILLPNNKYINKHICENRHNCNNPGSCEHYRPHDWSEYDCYECVCSEMPDGDTIKCIKVEDSNWDGE
jgi:hypothetical protein